MKAARRFLSFILNLLMTITRPFSVSKANKPVAVAYNHSYATHQSQQPTNGPSTSVAPHDPRVTISDTACAITASV
ncbi:uncharacterized protein LY79DRAFT_536468 [Colletotrichum navitas]|uniref:Secreted protein n=1 Tax=Colletotrichum navitas TaxID=681940 RepID=A0AAD8QAB2_9PEZI|nr:uncharacterized protein LY79DRAFT_536468 [Colletotrichum navitas]KAK1598950.1 hypothetical protein LY79DRAFT_536468 [Colletotrichum navitas]